MAKYPHIKAAIGVTAVSIILLSVFFYTQNEGFKESLHKSTGEYKYDAKAQLIAAGVIKE